MKTFQIPDSLLGAECLVTKLGVLTQRKTERNIALFPRTFGLQRAHALILICPGEFSRRFGLHDISRQRECVVVQGSEDS
mmetsp:Transcript_85186/g.138121  ORF Transcript_85186/g.138121 Transcript_85186/m.138121 type:complete len:80 (-) Transcript_85186:28-267(-)